MTITDTPEPTPVAPDPAPAPDPAAVADPAPEQDYKALWEREKNERIRERNLYKPAQQALRDLDDDTVKALTGLAELARAGDVEGIVDWSVGTIENLKGADLAAVIAARQNAGQPAPVAPAAPTPGFQQQPTTAPYDPDAVRQMVSEQVQADLRVREQVQAITGEIRAAGYDVNDPAGQSIIRYAQQTNVPIKDAVAWFEAEVAAKVAAKQGALAAAAAAVPQPAPTGAPPGSAPANMTPQEKAMARLRSYNAQ